MKEKKKMSLAMQIFIALVLAIAAGLLMQNHATFANTYIKPFGTIFLNLVKFIVVPIVLFSIMCGINFLAVISRRLDLSVKNSCILYVYNSICDHDRSDRGKLFKGMFPVIATTNLSYKMGETTSLMDTHCKYLPIKLCITNG